MDFEFRNILSQQSRAIKRSGPVCKRQGNPTTIGPSDLSN